MLQSRCIVTVLVMLLLSTNIYALRDPTRPPGASVLSGKKGATKLVLNAVIHSKSRNFAVINGKRLEVGDMIQGSKLLKIEKTAVYLDAPEGQIKLSITRHNSTVK